MTFQKKREIVSKNQSVLWKFVRKLNHPNQSPKVISITKFISFEKTNPPKRNKKKIAREGCISSKRRLPQNLIDFKYKQTIGFHLCLFIRHSRSHIGEMCIQKKDRKEKRLKVKISMWDAWRIRFATLNFMRPFRKILFYIFISVCVVLCCVYFLWYINWIKCERFLVKMNYTKESFYYKW